MEEIDKNYMNNKYNKFFLKKGQLQGTMYLEFKYCTAAKEFWNDDSYYIHGEVFEYLLPVFEKSKDEFSMFGENVFSFTEMNILINNLRVIELEKIEKDISIKDLSAEVVDVKASLLNLVRNIERWLIEAIELGVEVTILGI